MCSGLGLRQKLTQMHTRIELLDHLWLIMIITSKMANRSMAGLKLFPLKCCPSIWIPAMSARECQRFAFSQCLVRLWLHLNARGIFSELYLGLSKIALISMAKMVQPKWYFWHVFGTIGLILIDCWILFFNWGFRKWLILSQLELLSSLDGS